MRLVPFPTSLDFSSASLFSKEMETVALADECTFDFAQVGNTEPFGMLLTSSVIQHLRERHPNTKFRARNYAHVRYAAHMGFFKAFGLDFGKSPGEASGSSSYIPLTFFECDELERQAIANGEYVGETIESESKKLAVMLSRSDKGEVFDTLTYCLREIMRNVVEHSGAKNFGICAQFWPTKNKVEVAIVDRGIGLAGSLKANPHLTIGSDKSAINYALQPGISGKSFKGARQSKAGHWVNSGFGLYMTTRLCRNGGSFFLVSGESGMLLGKGKRYFESAFRGTGVRMVFDTNNIRNLTGSLASLRKEGEEIAAMYKNIAQIDPSSASLMLSRDFDKSIWSILRNAAKKK